MNEKIGWRNANQKSKSFTNKNIPKWLWITTLILLTSGLISITQNCPKFEQEQALDTQTAQDEPETSVGGQILAKTRLVAIDPYVDGDQEPRYRFGTVGVASYYDYTLDGIEWSKSHNTCASRDHKRYSTIRVTNPANGKSVDCYVNDYGPEIGQTPERIIDLSSHAFNQIADLKLGLIEVIIEEIN